MNGQQQGGLFRKKPVPIAQPRNEVGEVVRRLRNLEERYSNLERRLQVNEQNMLSSDRKINVELKTLNSELRDIKNSVEEVKERIRMLVVELRETARAEDVEVLKKYMSFWEPMRFVTQEEVERIVKSIIDEKQKF